jgi:hypothetical protein
MHDEHSLAKQREHFFFRKNAFYEFVLSPLSLISNSTAKVSTATQKIENNLIQRNLFFLVNQRYFA